MDGWMDGWMDGRKKLHQALPTAARTRPPNCKLSNYPAMITTICFPHAFQHITF